MSTLQLIDSPRYLGRRPAPRRRQTSFTPSRSAALLLCLAALIPLGCGETSQDPLPGDQSEPDTYEYEIPIQADDGWPTGSLASVGVDSVSLIQLMNRLYGQADHRIHAILLVRNGVLVLEEYFAGERYVSPGVGAPTVFTRETTHFQASVTKSVTATLLGITRDRGLLDLSTPALSFFPSLSDLNEDGRENITLAHMVSMRSGLPWDESMGADGSPPVDVVQLHLNPDPIRYILAKEMEAPAGTLFRYNSGCTNVLGKIVELVSGLRLDQFAEEVLFSSLGIEDYQWDLLQPGLVSASGGLWLRPRDMAKIGELYLRDGAWEGEQLVSNSWIAESTVSRSTLSYGWADGYGYGWWKRTYFTDAGPIETFFAAGWGEQQIVVVPDLEVVAVFTGGSYESGPYLSPGDVMATYVLPAALN